jgi:hypothetical protein
LLKHIERENPASCWNKAEPDEPIFVLLGRDPAAKIAIDAWINERIRIGKNDIGDPQIVEAHAAMWGMHRYAEQREDAKKKEETP